MADPKKATAMDKVLDNILVAFVALIALSILAAMIQPYIGLAVLAGLVILAFMAYRRTRYW